MKESNFYSDDFEQLIRGKTEQYKMYPSENVWKGVHNSLHTKRKWFIGSMALLVTGILYLSGKELIAPSPSAHPSLVHKTTGAAGATADLVTDPSRTNASDDLPRSSFATLRPNNTTGSSARHNGPADFSITISNLVISQPDVADLLSRFPRVDEQAPMLIAATGRPAAETADHTTDDDATGPGLLDSWLVKNSTENATAPKTTDAIAASRNNNEAVATGGISGVKGSIEGTTGKEAAGDAGSDDADIRSVLESLNYKAQQRAGNASHLARARTDTKSIDGDLLPDSAQGSSDRASTAAIGENADRQRTNWLRDYAVYSLPPSTEKSRLMLQFTLAPIVNYRTLSGGNYPMMKNAEGAPISSAHPEGVQNWVNLSPGFGFEFGSNVLYRVTRNLSLKGGLQFTFSRYQMPAYISKPQQSASPLNSYYGYYTDSMTSMTNSGSYPGKTTETLTNNFYQLAAPIGFELRILGNEQLQFNIAATIQPSYLLNTNSYMLSSDYSNYTRQPSLYRRWNVGGSAEAFLSYQTGPLRWQVGPEFRYQLLSTYTGDYPINENVKGFGLKFGITKSLP